MHGWSVTSGGISCAAVHDSFFTVCSWSASTNLLSMSTASKFLDRAKTTTTEIIEELLTVKHKEVKCPSVTEGCVLLACVVLVSRTRLTHMCPDILKKSFTLNTLKQKKPSRFCKRWPPTKNNREKHSATSSLNKGSPSSEVRVSRMPKLHSAKAN